MSSFAPTPILAVDVAALLLPYLTLFESLAGVGFPSFQILFPRFQEASQDSQGVYGSDSHGIGV